MDGKATKTIRHNDRKIDLSNYTAPDHSNFGLTKDASVDYNGRPSLPVDHPDHDDVLKKVAVSRLPSMDILHEEAYNVVKLAADLRSAVASKIDVDAGKLKEFDFTGLIVSAKHAAAVRLHEEPQKPASSDNAVVLALAASQQALATSQQEANENISSLAASQRQTNDNVSGLVTSVSALAGSVATLNGNVRQLESTVAVHDTEIAGLKTRMDELTTSTQKSWGEMKQLRHQQAASVERKSLTFDMEDNHAASPFGASLGGSSASSPFGASLGGSSVASGSPMRPVDEDRAMEGVELSDIADLDDKYIMTRFKSLAPGSGAAVDTSLLTTWQIKNVDEFFRNLGRDSLESMKSDFAESEIMVLNRDVSALAELESLDAFSHQLDGSILAIPDSNNSHSAVYIVPENCDTFVASDFLPAVSGAGEVELDIATDDNVSLTVMARTAKDATSTFVTLLHLAAKGSTKSVDVEFSSQNDMIRGDRVDLPLCAAEPMSLVRPVTLSLLKCTITQIQQAANLVRCCNKLKFQDCALGDAAGSAAIANCFVDTIAGGLHGLETITFKSSGLQMDPTAMSNLVKGACRHGTNSGFPRLVFDGTYCTPTLLMWCVLD